MQTPLATPPPAVRYAFVRTNLWLLLSLAGVAGLLAWPFLHGQLYAGTDVRELAVFGRLHLVLGHARALWNPWLHRGFDASEVWGGLFHPLFPLLYSLLPAGPGLAVELLLPFPVALVGGWLLLRRQYRWAGDAAFFGGCVYAFSVVPLAHFGQVGIPLIVAHLPWLVWVAERLLAGQGGARDAAWFALLCGSLLLLNHPQFTLLCALATALVLVFRGLVSRGAPAFRRGVAWLVLGAALGLLLGLVQLVSTAVALPGTARGHLTPTQRDNFSLPPANLVTNLNPGLYRERLVGDVVDGANGDGNYVENPSEFAGYFGIGLLTLVFLGVLHNRREWLARERRWAWLAVGALAVACLLLTLGRYGGLSQFPGQLPGFTMFRAPNRTKLVLAALLCLAAAWTVERIRRDAPGDLGRGGRVLAWLPCVLSALLSLAALALGQLSYRGQTVALGRGLALLWGPVVSAAVTSIFLLAPAARRRVLPIALAVVFLDVCVYYLPTVQRVPRCTFAQIAAAQARLANEAHPYRWIADSNHPLWLGAWLATGYTAMAPAPGLDYRQLAHLRLAAVARGWTAERQADVLQPLPRVRLVPELQHRENPLAELDREPLATVAHCRPEVGPELRGPPLAASEQVMLRYDGLDRLEIEANVSCPRLLVIADRWAPDWRASIDGRPAPILPLYLGTSRGLRLPPGRSTVVMWYACPATVRWGGLVAAAGLLGVLGLLTVPWWRRPTAVTTGAAPP